MGTERSKHSLVIGGTGMLLNVSKYLAENCSNTIVVARSDKSLARLQGHRGIECLKLDYTKQDDFILGLERVLGRPNPIDVVVSWIHGNAGNTPYEIASKLAERNPDIVFIDIVGSAFGNPADPRKLEHRRDGFMSAGIKNLRTIILGFKIENGSSRWLTNIEISEGIIRTLSKPTQLTTIGTTDPWEMKP